MLINTKNTNKCQNFKSKDVIILITSKNFNNQITYSPITYTWLLEKYKKGQQNF